MQTDDVLSAIAEVTSTTMKFANSMNRVGEYSVRHVHGINPQDIGDYIMIYRMIDGEERKVYLAVEEKFSDILDMKSVEDVYRAGASYMVTNGNLLHTHLCLGKCGKHYVLLDEDPRGQLYEYEESMYECIKHIIDRALFIDALYLLGLDYREIFDDHEMGLTIDAILRYEPLSEVLCAMKVLEYEIQEIVIEILLEFSAEDRENLDEYLCQSRGENYVRQIYDLTGIQVKTYDKPCDWIAFMVFALHHMGKITRETMRTKAIVWT